MMSAKEALHNSTVVTRYAHMVEGQILKAIKKGMQNVRIMPMDEPFMSFDQWMTTMGKALLESLGYTVIRTVIRTGIRTSRNPYEAYWIVDWSKGREYNEKTNA